MNILTQNAVQPRVGAVTPTGAPAPAPAPAAGPAPAPGGSVASSYDVQGAAGAMKGPTELKVTDNMLASKQLDSILSRDNPLMQKARARAQMAANRRGLLNSTMAANAGESAMIDAAMPLAQQDASTNFRAGEFNAGASNDFSRDDNRFGRDVAMARFGALVGAEEKATDRSWQSSENLLERSFRSSESAADRGFRTSERIASQGFEADQRGLDRQQQVRMQEMGQQFQMDFEKFKLPMNMMSSFTDKMQDYVSQVMRDPNMDAAAKDQAIANYYSYSRQQMGWMSTFFGKPMPNMQGGPNIQPPGTAPPPAPPPPPNVGVPPGQTTNYPPPPYRGEPPPAYAPPLDTNGPTAGLPYRTDGDYGNLLMGTVDGVIERLPRMQER